MIVDAHAHIFPDALAERAMAALSKAYGATPVGSPTCAGLLAHMDECGVDRAVVVPVATRPAQVGPANEWVLGLGEPRLIAFGALHPHSETLAEDIQGLVDRGVRGVKLQPWFQGYKLDDPGVWRMLELIGDRLIVLMHGGGELAPIPEIPTTPDRLAGLVRRFPEVRFIFAHLGGSGQWDEAEEHLLGLPVTLDASMVFDCCGDEQIRRIIRAHGPERVVWGSDYPWQTAALGIAGVKRLGLTEEETLGILGGNVLRLLGWERAS
jgi:predicted TIM-barrel fold metal-dependent hydrolase